MLERHQNTATYLVPKQNFIQRRLWMLGASKSLVRETDRTRFDDANFERYKLVGRVAAAQLS